MEQDTALGNQLTRLFLGYMLTKMGGEVKMTQQDIDATKQIVGGIQILLTPQDEFVLRVKTPETINNNPEKYTIL